MGSHPIQSGWAMKELDASQTGPADAQVSGTGRGRAAHLPCGGGAPGPAMPDDSLSSSLQIKEAADIIQKLHLIAQELPFDR